MRSTFRSPACSAIMLSPLATSSEPMPNGR